MKKGISLLRATLCAAAFITTASASAQNYPTRTVTFIYPYAAGSLADTAWRSIVQEASRRLGQTLLFENRPGAGGRLGLDAIMRAKPDGYTIGAAPNALTVVQALVEPSMYIEPDKNYTAVVNCIETYLLLVTRANAPFRDLNSLIAHARANPGKLNAGSPGAGTGSHLGLAMLGTRAGISFTTVHYKGSAPVMTALLSGEVDMTVADPAAKPHMDAGKLIGIAVTGSQRWAQFPGLPTMHEAGLSGFNYVSWHGVVAPPGLPAGIVAALNRAFNDALANAELRARLESAGWVVKGGSAADMASLIRTDLEVFRPVVKAANIKLD